MIEEDDLISFSGFRGLAKWLLNNQAGKRFVNWFIRKHYKEVLQTEAGASLYGYLQKEAAGDVGDNRAIIVIESAPVNDGSFHFRVFASFKCSVYFAKLIKIENYNPFADEMSQGIAMAELPWRARKIYLDTKALVGMDVHIPENVEEYSLRQAEVLFNEHLTDVIFAQKDFEKSDVSNQEVAEV